jgi:hypothetical protein
MSLFQKRHYEWLAAFAARELTDQQRQRLAVELHAASGYDINGNKSFDRERFLIAATPKPVAALFPTNTPKQRREAARIRRVGY